MYPHLAGPLMIARRLGVPRAAVEELLRLRPDLRPAPGLPRRLRLYDAQAVEELAAPLAAIDAGEGGES